VISVQRNGSEFINPGPQTILKAGDLLWIVGDPDQFDKMK
ncbi:MAG: TrkA C-terminal domain-containing protein, partial [Muribaculaceae bacterium]|nr:TrkA C-terminal domain-containing protein [Muribaculaceae bacterium]